MKTYTIAFEEMYYVEIDAENEEEALDFFTAGEYDNPRYREITHYEIIDSK